MRTIRAAWLLLVTPVVSGCAGLLEGEGEPATRQASAQSCAPATGSPCSFAGLSVPSGASLTAYQAATVPAGQSCASEIRTCTNGSLSGSFSSRSCGPSVATGAGIPATILNGLREGGVNLVFGWYVPEDFQPNQFDADLPVIKAKGGGHVRLVISMDVLEDGESGALRQDRWQELKAFVGRAKAAGLVTIIDNHNTGLHNPDGTWTENYMGRLDDAGVRARHVSLMSALAAKIYQELDRGWVILQPANEPIDGTFWYSHQDVLMPALRKSCPDCVLFALAHNWQTVGTTIWSLKPSQTSWWDSRMIVDLHLYVPLALTHCSYPGQPNTCGGKQWPGIYTDWLPASGTQFSGLWNKELLESELGKLWQWQASHGDVPLHFSEIGTTAALDDAPRSAYLTDLISILAARGVGWSCYEWSQNFGIASAPKTLQACLGPSAPVVAGGGAPCSFAGTTVASGASVTAYAAASVPAGQSCLSEVRTCSDGVLSGSHAHAFCQVATEPGCAFGPTCIASGATVIAYQSATVPAGQSCTSEVRACSAGTLSGSFAFASCSVGVPQSDAGAPTADAVVAKEAGPGSTVEIHAAGTQGSGDYPRMRLLVKGIAVASFRVTPFQPGTWSGPTQVYTHKHPGKLSAKDLRVQFYNDANGRDLFVDRIIVDGQSYESEAPTTFSFGSWGANGCGPGYKRSEWLHCNGYFQY